MSRDSRIQTHTGISVTRSPKQYRWFQHECDSVTEIAEENVGHTNQLHACWGKVGGHCCFVDTAVPKCFVHIPEVVQL